MKYYNHHNIYVAIFGNYEIGVNLNDLIDTGTPLGIEYYVNNGFKEITHEQFCHAYDKTLKFITEQYSRLNMMYTDANIPQATEADKQEEREDIFEKLSGYFKPTERFPADDVHRGEHKEFEL